MIGTPIRPAPRGHHAGAPAHHGPDPGPHQPPRLLHGARYCLSLAPCHDLLCLARDQGPPPLETPSVSTVSWCSVEAPDALVYQALCLPILTFTSFSFSSWQRPYPPPPEPRPSQGVPQLALFSSRGTNFLPDFYEFMANILGTFLLTTPPLKGPPP